MFVAAPAIYIESDAVMAVALLAIALPSTSSFYLQLISMINGRKCLSGNEELCRLI